MLVNTNDLLLDALDGGYAVGAFNIYNMETVQGISKACAELNSPVIFQISKGAKEYAGNEFLVNLVKTSIKEYNLKASLHLDHGTTFEICKEFIDYGFTSVMIDASNLQFDENVKLTRKVVEYARNFGVSVEAEIGQLLGIEGSNSSGSSIYTNPKQACDFANLTQINSLAIAIGTRHGAFKFNNKSNIDLKFEVVEEIHKTIPDLPIVLHGASCINSDVVNKLKKFGIILDDASGVPEEILTKASKTAISKVNIDTDIRLESTLAIMNFMSENPKNFDPRNFLNAMRDSIENITKYKIKILGSENKIH